MFHWKGILLIAVLLVASFFGGTRNRVIDSNDAAPHGYAQHKVHIY